MDVHEMCITFMPYQFLTQPALTHSTYIDQGWVDYRYPFSSTVIMAFLDVSWTKQWLSRCPDRYMAFEQQIKCRLRPWRNTTTNRCRTFFSLPFFVKWGTNHFFRIFIFVPHNLTRLIGITDGFIPSLFALIFHFIRQGGDLSRKATSFMDPFGFWGKEVYSPMFFSNKAMVRTRYKHLQVNDYSQCTIKKWTQKRIISSRNPKIKVPPSKFSASFTVFFFFFLPSHNSAISDVVIKKVVYFSRFSFNKLVLLSLLAITTGETGRKKSTALNSRSYQSLTTWYPM